MVPFDGKYQPLCKSYVSIVRLLSPFLRYSHFKIGELESVGQRPDVQRPDVQRPDVERPDVQRPDVQQSQCRHPMTNT